MIGGWEGLLYRATYRILIKMAHLHFYHNIADDQLGIFFRDLQTISSNKRPSKECHYKGEYSRTNHCPHYRKGLPLYSDRENFRQAHLTSYPHTNVSTNKADDYRHEATAQTISRQ